MSTKYVTDERVRFNEDGSACVTVGGEWRVWYADKSLGGWIAVNDTVGGALRDRNGVLVFESADDAVDGIFAAVEGPK